MKKILVACAAFLAAHSAFAIAASQAWVTNYVAQALATSRAELESTATVTSSNGVTEISVGSGLKSMRLVVEDATDAALMATNSAVNASVTNGTLFVWNGAGQWISGDFGAILSTPTNFAYAGCQSIHTNGVDRFPPPQGFDVVGVMIQPHTSFAITNAASEVEQ